MSSDCLLLALPQGLERQRIEGWQSCRFALGEGEEQGFQRTRTPPGTWTAPEQVTLRGRPGDSAVWYRTEFTHPGWGERTLLRFDGAFTAANVWLNGRLLGSHFGFPGHFGFDISSFLETSNVLAVCVEAGEHAGPAAGSAGRPAGRGRAVVAARPGRPGLAGAGRQRGGRVPRQLLAPAAGRRRGDPADLHPQP